MAPLSVSVALVSLISAPFPLSVPALSPALTVRVVAPLKLSVPPLSALTLEVDPFKFNTPPLTVPSVAAPVTVNEPPLTVVTPAVVVTPTKPPLTVVLASAFAFTTPPLMSDVSRPATFTVPRLSPPVIVAFDANRVFPAPDSDASVIVPLAAVKDTLSAVAFRLLTAPRLNPIPLIVANPLASTLRVAALL